MPNFISIFIKSDIDEIWGTQNELLKLFLLEIIPNKWLYEET